MAISGVTSKCYILTLFERDDGARLLLGSGAYEFKDGQQHFEANDMVNDTVDVQGTDGILLAGQVRRASTQSFDGYIGDGTTTKAKVEEYRRDFIEFFAKNHFYKAVYVFSDGSAIMRQRGFIVDAPEVKELYQIHPEYHVALNFEDVNYYEYDEDAEGEEIYSQTLRIARVDAEQGGLVWDEYGAVMLPMGTSTATVSGSNFTIDDALPLPPDDVQLLGETEQASYSGKNLCDLSNFQSATNLGLTTSWNNSSPSITINGTTTGSGNFYPATSTGITLPAGSYRLSLQLVGGSFTLNSRNGGLYVSTGGSSPVASALFSTISVSDIHRASSTFTLSESAEIRLYLYINGSGAVFNNTSFELQIETGTTSTSYEPYVGGIPSPNPDYPQAIETVTGLQTVSFTGKNLFNQGDVQWVRNNNSNYKSTDDTNTTRIRTQDLIRLVGGRTYTISGFPDGITLGRVKFYTDPSATNEYSLVESSTFTVPANATYVIFQFNGTNFTSETKTLMANSDIQLEYGSTATSYEPYTVRTVEVNLGKNLFDKNNANILIGYFDVNGVVQSGGNSSIDTDYHPIESGNPYTISGNIIENICFYDSDKTFLKRVASINTDPVTFTENASYFRFQIKTANFNVNAIQLERGSVATSYSPYFDPIELCKIGDYQDRIYEDGGKWYLEKKVGNVTLDGTESWSTNTAAGRQYYIAFTSAEPTYIAGGYATHFQIGSTGRNVININSSATLLVVVQPYYNGSIIDSIADWKTWLKAHLPMFYYALATPTTTEITNEQVLAGLNQLSGGSLYAGENNIVVASEDEPATLQMTYQIPGGEDPGGFEWEEGGGGGIVSVMVDSIDNVYPLITITGPATDPAIENLTTGTSMTYTGTVGVGQELVIDTMAQTAKLNGTNVLSNLYGDFIYLAPGYNRIAFTTANSDAPASLAQFNEVVG